MAVAGMVAAMGAGCTGLEPAALSAGASVAQTGVTVFDRGKARTIELARFDDVVGATRRAIAELSLTPTLEDPTPGRLRLGCADERGGTVILVLQRHTETMTLIQADVGIFGEIGIATLVVRRILAELTASGGLPPPPEPPEGQTPPPAPESAGAGKRSAR